MNKKDKVLKEMDMLSAEVISRFNKGDFDSLTHDQIMYWICERIGVKAILRSSGLSDDEISLALKMDDTYKQMVKKVPDISNKETVKKSQQKSKVDLRKVNKGNGTVH